MKTLLLALALLLAPGAAWAGCEIYSGDPPSTSPRSELCQIVDRWYDAHLECRQGITRDERILTAEQSDKSCEARSAIAAVLKERGQCWDQSEQTWETCR